MAAQDGYDFLLKVGDGATSETFTEVAACRATSITINNQTVDITTKGSSHFRNLLSGAGHTSVSITANGIYTDAATDTTLETASLARTSKNYQVVSGGGITFAGAFIITSYGRSGAYDGAEDFSITLESAGTVTAS